MKRGISLLVLLLIVSTIGFFGIAYGSVKANNDANDKVDYTLMANETYNEHIYTTSNKKIIDVELAIKTLQDLEKHKAIQRNFLTQLRKSIRTEAEKALISKSLATITFKKPISIEALQTLINENSLKLKDFEAKFINDKGEWGTGCLKVPKEEAINELASNIIKSGKEKQLTFEGVTSARLILNLQRNDFEKLSSNDDIYLVDITDTIIRLHHGDFKNKIKIRIPDLAWEIDKIK